MNIFSARLPTIHNYAEAVARLEKSVPLRSGRERGKFPLGDNRRYKHCQIARVEGTQAIALQLYGSDVVVWYPGNTVHISICNYNTVATRQFIWAVTSFAVKYERGTTYLGVSPDGKWYKFVDDETPLVVKDNVVQNPVQEVVYRLDRKAMATKRQEFGLFLEYVTNMGKLTTGITEEEVERLAEEKGDKLPRLMLPTAAARYYHGKQTPLEGLAEFMLGVKKAQETDDLIAYYRLFVTLGLSSLNYHATNSAFTFGRYPKYATPLPIDAPMLEFFNEAIKYLYGKEVFKQEAVPLGKKVSNESRKYFN